MADYWGSERIAKRLGCSLSTLRTWHRTKGFLMYRRKRAIGVQSSWYTNDNLIHTWELARCQQDRSMPWRQRTKTKGDSVTPPLKDSPQTSKENTGLRDGVRAPHDPVGSDNRDYVNPHGQ